MSLQAVDHLVTLEWFPLVLDDPEPGPAQGGRVLLPLQQLPGVDGNLVCHLEALFLVDGVEASNLVPLRVYQTAHGLTGDDGLQVLRTRD